MSGKQDKRLRKAARGLAVVLDEAGKKIVERGLLSVEHRAASPSSLTKDRAEPGRLLSVTAVNRPDSLRGIIRNLKKGLGAGL
jgi:hypothetical protein